MSATDEDGCLARPGGTELFIPAREFWFEFDHARGPGGQHVNKTATRATLCFHPDSSGVLDPGQKQRLRAALAGRIGQEGVLRITVESERSQFANRAAARRRFVECLEKALTPRPRRIPTQPTRASRLRRLNDKRHASLRKTNRQAPPGTASE